MHRIDTVEETAKTASGGGRSAVMDMRRARSACASLLLLVATSWAVQSASAVSIAECSTDRPRGNLSLGPSWQDRLPAKQQTDGLEAGSCDVWVIPPSAFKGTPCGSGAADGYVLVEFWKLRKNDSGWVPAPRSASPKVGISIVAAKGGVPGLVMPMDDSAMQQASPFSSLAAPASPRSAGADGQPGAAADGSTGASTGHSSSFYWDATAAAYLHPYHRLFLPLNALAVTTDDSDAGNSSSSSRAGNKAWYLQVTNRNAGGLLLPGYSLRATCLPNRSLIPCPAADPGSGECSDRGGCLAAPSMTPVPPQQRSYCSCAVGWGGPSCEQELLVLDLNPATPQQLVVEPGAWQYYMVELPPAKGQGVQDLELLAELSRAPGRQGGDPLLFLKPADSADRMLPFLDTQQQDLSTYADMDSFMLQQSYHYVLKRIQRPAAAVPRRWYVAVFNHNSTQELREARVALRVLYRDLSSESLVCPKGCSGNGACTNPLPLSASSSISGNSPLPRQVGIADGNSVNNVAAAGFDCVCAPGWGGVLCEGQLRNVTVGGGNQLQGPWPLAPGAWNFYLLTVDPGFNNKYSNLGVQWFIGMVNDVTGGNFSNGYLMFSKSTFPREPAAQDDQWRKGLISYAALAARSNPPRPIEVQGRDLIPGQTYVMGVLNSEYLVADPFIYSLRFFVPGDVPTLLHPYMSIVLGVTAAVLLCLVMTLAKRVIMRMGWLGWQRPQTLLLEELEGEAGAQGPRGVPEDIYTAFPTYTYSSKDAAAAGKVAAPGDTPRDEAAPKDAGDSSVTAHKQVAVPVADVTVQVPAAAAAGVGAVTSSEPVPTSPPAGAAAAAADAAADPEKGQGAAGAGSGGPATPTSAAASAASTGAAATALVDDEGSESDDVCCPVCLCEYMDGEVLRELPCHHVFHQPCIDKWMVAHSTCPCCRTPLWEGAAEHLEQAMHLEQAAAEQRAAAEAERMRQPWYRLHPRQLFAAMDWTRRVPTTDRSLQLPTVAGRQAVAQQDEQQQRRRQRRQLRQQRRRERQQQQGVPDVQRQPSRSLQQLVSLSRQASATAGAAVARQWSGIAAAVGMRSGSSVSGAGDAGSRRTAPPPEAV